MAFSIASYSFHRLLETGQGDTFTYIETSQSLGAAQLDPWNAHLTDAHDRETIAKVGGQPGVDNLMPGSAEFIARIKKAAEEAGLPFGCLAIDGGHIFEPTAELRQANRDIAYRWLDVAQELNAKQVRIDAGGPEDLPNDVFGIIVEGYTDLVRRGRDLGIVILMENHWGPSIHPQNVLRILQAVDGLGLLLDSNNWAEGHQVAGWQLTAQYARSVHIKTFEFDEQGLDTTVNIPQFMRILLDAGYDGVWGIESCPYDGDEIGAVQKTIALIQHVLVGEL